MARGGPSGKKGSSRKNGAASSSPSVARWDRADEIPLDEEENFHAGRDKVLLNGGDEEDDDEEDEDIGGDQREVLGLGDSDLDEDSDEGDVEQDEDPGDQDEDGDARTPRQYKRLEKEKAARDAAQISDDDEVPLSDEDDSDDDTTRWGANKKAYYNTNDLDDMDEDSEIDEEEARRMELNEVKKLQARSRKGMEDSDFGLGEADVLGGAEEGGKGVKDRQRRRMELDDIQDVFGGFTSASAEAAPASTSTAAEVPDGPRARAQLLARLQQQSPETVALAGEYADAVEQLIRVESTLLQVTKTQPKHPSLGMMHLHYQTLYTYVTTLTFYFHLRASSRYASRPADLAAHPVLGRLLKLKEGLSVMEDLDFAVPLDDEEENLSSMDEMEEQSQVEDDIDHLGQMASSDDDDGDAELDEDELASLIADKDVEVPKSKKKSKQSKADSNDVAKAHNKKGKQQETAQKKPKQATDGALASSPQPGPVSFTPPLAGLLDADDSLDLSRRSSSSGKKRSSSSAMPGEAYGEATSLTASEQEDKAEKKRSLRFYTGQMDAKEQRRGQAARDRMGGDSDLPYRDRDRSRQGAEQARAAREGKLKTSEQTALDDAEFDAGDAQDWRDVMGASGDANGGSDHDDGDDDDYYDLVSSGRKSAKRAKKASYDEERDSSRVILDDTISDEPGAHRAVNRQIQTNRGLTPHRKQDRNLRVKKRKKYEKAQKKLSSTRAVYKGGQGALQGGYQGEKSGINSAVAKSRRFAS